MRIALFTNNYLPFCGGVTISVETLRQGLDAAGHEAWVFGPRLAGAQDPSDRIVRYPSIPATTYPEFALAVPYSRRIARTFTGLHFDVVHAHHPFLLGPAARRLARRTRRPLVFTYHTRYEKYAHYVPLPPGLVESAAIRLSAGFAARADAVLAPSTVIRDEFQARGVRTPIAVVPTGVDLARFRPGDRAAARRRLGVAEGDALLLYVGRLDREKSVDRVLVAFERVASTVVSARLLLVGHGTEAARLRAWPAALSVAPRIRFLGVRPHDELAECYRAADVFLFASETETQGLVLAEAAACGAAGRRRGRARLRGGRARRRDGHPDQERSDRAGGSGDRAPARSRAAARHGATRPARSPSASSTCACRSTGRWRCTLDAIARSR